MLCIRGAGYRGVECAERIIKQSVQNVGICFADRKENGIRQIDGKELDVFSVATCVEMYYRKIIKKFLIPLEYAESLFEEIVQELLEQGITKEDIVIIPQYGMQHDWVNLCEYEQIKLPFGKNDEDCGSITRILFGTIQDVKWRFQTM